MTKDEAQREVILDIARLTESKLVLGPRQRYTMPDQPSLSPAGVHLIVADPWSKEWGQPHGMPSS